MISEICSAIEVHKVISFYYRGGSRLVEPYCYGFHKKTGDEVLRGFQVGGFSEFGEPFGWKLYPVGEILGISITEKSYRGIREEYNPDDVMMKEIICRAEK